MRIGAVTSEASLSVRSAIGKPRSCSSHALIDRTTVTATPAHPFWVVGRGRVTVDQLHVGGQLPQPDDTAVTVDAVTAEGNNATVCNVEMVNGVTSVVPQFRMFEPVTGVSLHIGSVGILGDYDQYKYSSWLGSANATIDSFFIPGGNVGKVGSFLSKGEEAASAFSKLKFADEGIASFSRLRGLSQGQRGEVQIHHLIEQRFVRVMRDTLGASTNDWASIAVTRTEHQVFTNAWRAEIPYGATRTGAATAEQVTAAARRIYADYPDWACPGFG